MHAEGTQNNKYFTRSTKYFKKEVSDEVHFLHVDKHQGFF